jgi:hypothetical protein
MRFVGIHLLVKVLVPGKKVGNSVGVAGYVRQFIVEVLEVFDPLGLSTSNFLWLAEVLQIFMVGADFDGVRHPKKEGTITFESKQDGGKFLVVGVIILFGREEASRVEGDRVNSIIKLL